MMMNSGICFQLYMYIRMRLEEKLTSKPRDDFLQQRFCPKHRIMGSQWYDIKDRYLVWAYIAKFPFFFVTASQA